MAALTMVAVTVTQIIMADGVMIICHQEPAHAIVVMEPVIWEQLLMAIIVFAIKVSPVQNVRL